MRIAETQKGGEVALGSYEQDCNSKFKVQSIHDPTFSHSNDLLPLP